MANWFFMFIFSYDVHHERARTYRVCVCGVQLVLVQADTKHIDSWLDRICYFLFSLMVDWTEAALAVAATATDAHKQWPRMKHLRANVSRLYGNKINFLFVICSQNGSNTQRNPNETESRTTNRKFHCFFFFLSLVASTKKVILNSNDCQLWSRFEISEYGPRSSTKIMDNLHGQRLNRVHHHESINILDDSFVELPERAENGKKRI